MALVTKDTSATRFSPTPQSTCIFSAHGVLIARNLCSPNWPNLNPRFHKAGDNDQIQIFYCKHLSQSLSTNKIVRLTSQAMDVHCPLKLKKIFRNPHTSFSIKVLLPRHSCCACFCVSTRVCVHPNRRSPNHPVRHGWLLFISARNAISASTA